MSDIDWSKAPEDATHARFIRDDSVDGCLIDFYRTNGGIFEYLSKDGFWKLAMRGQHECVERPSVTTTPATPTLETMLTEWRDLEARAQAAQAEADALFEHAGQCHGEIVVRLAELGWGAPRMVPGEPFVTLDTPVLDMTDWRNWQVGDELQIIANEAGHGFEIGERVTLRSFEHDDPETPLSATGMNDYWFLQGGDAVFISRPSTQP